MFNKLLDGLFPKPESASSTDREIEEVEVHISAILSLLPLPEVVYEKDLLQHTVKRLLDVVCSSTKDPMARAAASILSYEVLCSAATSKALIDGFKDGIQFAEDRNSEVCCYLMNKLNKELVEQEGEIGKEQSKIMYSLLQEIVKDNT